MFNTAEDWMTFFEALYRQQQALAQRLAKTLIVTGHIDKSELLRHMRPAYSTLGTAFRYAFADALGEVAVEALLRGDDARDVGRRFMNGLDHGSNSSLSQIMYGVENLEAHLDRQTWEGAMASVQARFLNEVSPKPSLTQTDVDGLSAAFKDLNKYRRPNVTFDDDTNGMEPRFKPGSLLINWISPLMDGMRGIADAWFSQQGPDGLPRSEIEVNDDGKVTFHLGAKATAARYAFADAITDRAEQALLANVSLMNVGLAVGQALGRVDSPETFLYGAERLKSLIEHGDPLLRAAWCESVEGASCLTENAKRSLSQGMGYALDRERDHGLLKRAMNDADKGSLLNMFNTAVEVFALTRVTGTHPVPKGPKPN